MAKVKKLDNPPPVELSLTGEEAVALQALLTFEEWPNGDISRSNLLNGIHDAMIDAGVEL